MVGVAAREPPLKLRSFDCRDLCGRRYGARCQPLLKRVLKIAERRIWLVGPGRRLAVEDLKSGCEEGGEARACLLGQDLEARELILYARELPLCPF